MSTVVQPRTVKRRRLQPQPSRPAAPPPNPRRTDRRIAAALAVVLLLVYFASADLLPTTDAIGNMHLALSVLDEGNFSFTPVEKPFIFRWLLKADSGDEPVVVKQLDRYHQRSSPAQGAVRAWAATSLRGPVLCRSVETRRSEHRPAAVM